MTKLYISLLGDNECCVSHDKSTSKIITQSPIEYGGTGNEFSSTDLLVAAVGTCIATTIEGIIKRNKIELRNVEIITKKELSSIPKEIKYFVIKILIKENVELNVLNIIGKAAKSCLVYKNLKFKPEIIVVNKRY